MKEFLDRHFNFFVWNLEAGDLIEIFLVSAVSSLLLIRALLGITSYPQLGAGKFHIAHMLWGGFLMMIALIILFEFLNKESKRLAAVVGGIGFGAFIDELGKFITSDNDYFFQPTVALIYIIFILIFFSARVLERYLKASNRDYAINALEVVKEIILYDLDQKEKNRALQYLKESDPKNPAVIALKKMLTEMKAKSAEEPGILTRIRRILVDIYLKLLRTRWVAKLLLLSFIGLSILNLLKAFLNLVSISSFAEWGQLITSVASGLFILVGVYFIRHHRRLDAYEMFKRAVLISIFLTQFFLFYKEQLSALVALVISVFIFSVIQYLIDQEQLIVQKKT